MRGYPFQKIFYQLTHVEDFSGLFLFLAGLLLLVILIGIYFLIFKGLKHFVNKKIAGILSAVILITGTVTMYHYNRDYITEAYNIIKEAGGKAPRPVKANVGARLQKGEVTLGEAVSTHSWSKLGKTRLTEIENARTPEEIDAITKRMEKEPSLKVNGDEMTLLRAKAGARKWELKNAGAKAKMDAERAAREADRKAASKVERAILDSLLRTNKPLTAEQIKYVSEHTEDLQKAIIEHNKRFPDSSLDSTGRPVKSEPTTSPAPAPESAQPVTEAKPAEGLGDKIKSEDPVSSEQLQKDLTIPPGIKAPEPTVGANNLIKRVVDLKSKLSNAQNGKMYFSREDLDLVREAAKSNDPRIQNHLKGFNNSSGDHIEGLFERWDRLNPKEKGKLYQHATKGDKIFLDQDGKVIIDSSWTPEQVIDYAKNNPGKIRSEDLQKAEMSVQGNGAAGQQPAADAQKITTEQPKERLAEEPLNQKPRIPEVEAPATQPPEKHWFDDPSSWDKAVANAVQTDLRRLNPVDANGENSRCVHFLICKATKPSELDALKPIVDASPSPVLKAEWIRLIRQRADYINNKGNSFFNDKYWETVLNRYKPSKLDFNTQGILKSKDFKPQPLMNGNEDPFWPQVQKYVKENKLENADPTTPTKITSGEQNTNDYENLTRAAKNGLLPRRDIPKGKHYKEIADSIPKDISTVGAEASITSTGAPTTPLSGKTVEESLLGNSGMDSVAPPATEITSGTPLEKEVLNNVVQNKEIAAPARIKVPSAENLGAVNHTATKPTTKFDPLKLIPGNNVTLPPPTEAGEKLVQQIAQNRYDLSKLQPDSLLYNPMSSTGKGDALFNTIIGEIRNNPNLSPEAKQDALSALHKQVESGYFSLIDADGGTTTLRVSGVQENSKLRQIDKAIKRIKSDTQKTESANKIKATEPNNIESTPAEPPLQDVALKSAPGEGNVKPPVELVQPEHDIAVAEKTTTSPEVPPPETAEPTLAEKMLNPKSDSTTAPKEMPLRGTIKFDSATGKLELPIKPRTTSEFVFDFLRDKARNAGKKLLTPAEEINNGTLWTDVLRPKQEALADAAHRAGINTAFKTVSGIEEGLQKADNLGNMLDRHLTRAQRRAQGWLAEKMLGKTHSGNLFPEDKPDGLDRIAAKGSEKFRDAWNRSKKIMEDVGKKRQAARAAAQAQQDEYIANQFNTFTSSPDDYLLGITPSNTRKGWYYPLTENQYDLFNSGKVRLPSGTLVHNRLTGSRGIEMPKGEKPTIKWTQDEFYESPLFNLGEKPKIETKAVPKEYTIDVEPQVLRGNNSTEGIFSKGHFLNPGDNINHFFGGFAGNGAANRLFGIGLTGFAGRSFYNNASDFWNDLTTKGPGADKSLDLGPSMKTRYLVPDTGEIIYINSNGEQIYQDPSGQYNYNTGIYTSFTDKEQTPEELAAAEQKAKDAATALVAKYPQYDPQNPPKPATPDSKINPKADSGQAENQPENVESQTSKKPEEKGSPLEKYLPDRINSMPYGHSLFGTLAGGAIGAGIGGLNYILTDENELSEEEKKKRSLARAMLSSAGIGAGIGGLVGGASDFMGHKAS